MVSLYERALRYLRASLNNPQANFRDGQWESIEDLLARRRILVVQRTGWGKSSVYFLATKLLREQGAGPTLLVSPLLSLMRNQIEAAARIGVRAVTINSSNNEEWADIQTALTHNEVDILLISPERLANSAFRQDVLAGMASHTGLVVIDEAHCISDWGHDFRPDYRRIVRVLQAFPATVPVLATTATANNRVVDDIKSQLGDDLVLRRGTLIRSSLKLQNITMPDQAGRLAWLAQTIPALPGSGIIYTLTQRDAAQVAAWLQSRGLTAEAYHAGLEAMDRAYLEQALLQNDIKVLVATVALGMGFDKPDLGFVIHFQRPSSVVHYYQQVGRAGRAVDEAYGVLLHGHEDDNIADYFIQSAFPPQQHVAAILNALDQSENGLSVSEMEGVLNLRKGQLEKALRFLTVESPSPVVKASTRWQATASAATYRVDQAQMEAITRIRRQEQAQMADYMRHTGCLMSFLQTALDDPDPAPCGRCRNCNPDGLLPTACDPDLANAAASFLRRTHHPILPRKRWPKSNMFQHSPLKGSTIDDTLRPQEGRALALWNDAGWGTLVAHGRTSAHGFADDLVTACVAMLQLWQPSPAPTWVTCVPSLNHPDLVPDVARRLAAALHLPFVPCLQKLRPNAPQSALRNSFQQAKNLDGVFSVTQDCKKEACLLVDDFVDSGWTFTVAAALLRQAGCSAVHPLALALYLPRAD